MRKVVGIDRKIKRAWLDAVLDRLAQTTDEAELRRFLDEHLEDELPGKSQGQVHRHHPANLERHPGQPDASAGPGRRTAAAISGRNASGCIGG